MKLNVFTFLFFSGILSLTLISCNSGNTRSGELLDTDVVTNPNTASGNESKGDLPVIVFEETEHNFGRIIEGETVSFSFAFTNTGKRDLVIAEVSTSCGCAVASYPKTVIKPGEKGAIKISFNSRGRKGFQTKTIVVVANTQPNVTQLKIKSQVVVPGE